VKAIVGPVKRSTPYRRICSILTSRCPRDVWLEGRTGFVHFEGSSGEANPIPTWFVFAVDLDTSAVIAAKRLRPDEGSENIRISDVDRGLSLV